MIREHLPCLSGALRVVCGDVAFVLVRTRQEMQMGCHSPSLLLFQTYVIIHSYSGESISFVLMIVLLEHVFLFVICNLSVAFARASY